MQPAQLSPTVTRLSGVAIDSFYVKAAFSPDGRFIVSGSSDNYVHLFEVLHQTLVGSG